MFQLRHVPIKNNIPNPVARPAKTNAYSADRVLEGPDWNNNHESQYINCYHLSRRRINLPEVPAGIHKGRSRYAAGPQKPGLFAPMPHGGIAKHTVLSVELPINQ
ncbi:hypothetical protein JTB14_019226 [Gonioctena quinquepunctata]|nr:hypothetical protein JTB14_019226 [Gonioctena quinquepunctata]